MSHPHGPDFAHADSGGQSETKTLLVTVGIATALLHSVSGARERSRKLRFADPHAALDWCLAHDANMMLLRAPGDASKN